MQDNIGMDWIIGGLNNIQLNVFDRGLTNLGLNLIVVIAFNHLCSEFARSLQRN